VADFVLAGFVVVVMGSFGSFLIIVTVYTDFGLRFGSIC
jgi:hypothetical protein